MTQATTPDLVVAPGGAGASSRSAGCSWRVPWRRGTRAEVWRVWGVGGVLPIAVGGMCLRAFTASCSFALMSAARASRGAEELRIELLVLLVSAMGPRYAC